MFKHLPKYIYCPLKYELNFCHQLIILDSEYSEERFYEDIFFFSWKQDRKSSVIFTVPLKDGKFVPVVLQAFFWKVRLVFES